MQRNERPLVFTGSSEGPALGAAGDEAQHPWVDARLDCT